MSALAHPVLDIGATPISVSIVQSRAALFATLLLLATYAPSAAAQSNEIAREYRRGAMQIWNQDKVQQDSLMRAEKETATRVELKLKAFLANNKDALEHAGRYGDADALKREPSLPSWLAGQIVADLEDAAKTKQSQWQEIKSERAQNPSALDLYRDEVHAQFAVSALTRRLYVAKVNVNQCEMIELYYNVRLAAASGVSREAYAEELDHGRQMLADTYQAEQELAHASSTMMNFFLSY